MRRKGSRAVTETWVASVSHHIAIHKVTAAILVTSGWPGDKSAKKNVRKKAAGPASKAIIFAGFK